MLMTRSCRMLQKALHIDGGLRHHILWRREDVLQKGLRHDAQRDLAIDAAEGQIVNLVAEGRDVWALSGIHLHRQHVIAAWVELWPCSQLEGERRVTALVLAELVAVEPDG